MFLLYVINILDRTNIGIAKLQMLDDLEMDEAAYGLARDSFTSATCCSRSPAI